MQLLKKSTHEQTKFPVLSLRFCKISKFPVFSLTGVIFWQFSLFCSGDLLLVPCYMYSLTGGTYPECEVSEDPLLVVVVDGGRLHPRVVRVAGVVRVTLVHLTKATIGLV